MFGPTYGYQRSTTDHFPTPARFQADKAVSWTPCSQSHDTILSIAHPIRRLVCSPVSICGHCDYRVRDDRHNICTYAA